MTELTKSQRKAVNQKVSKLQQTQNNNLTLQQNHYHMGASEIDALSRMQNAHPDLVSKIMDFKQQELTMQNDIIFIEKTEQDMRNKEIPYVRAYAFFGQFMAYSIGIFTLAGGAYFGYIGNTIVSGLFLTSTVGVAFAQFFKFRNKTSEGADKE